MKCDQSQRDFGFLLSLYSSSPDHGFNLIYRTNVVIKVSKLSLIYFPVDPPPGGKKMMLPSKLVSSYPSGDYDFSFPIAEGGQSER